MIIMALHDLLVLTLENCPRICGSFNSLSIFIKKRLFKAFLKIKNIFKNEKICCFCGFEKEPQVLLS
jgi:hypothetical protein